MVISIDRDYIAPIDGAYVFSNADITDSNTILKLEKALNGLKANSVLSDMVQLSFSLIQHILIALQLKLY
jgi:23S rRNA U2552 (ribose-2'-O)-methylase RlmE/FtsJ